MARVFQERLDWTEGKTMPDGRPFPERWGFYCPGCRAELQRRQAAGELDIDDESCHDLSLHMMNVRDVHRFNGDVERPTFEPSIMAHGAPSVVCHSYVRAGRIQYLDDCTHAMRGTTIDLPEVD